MKNTEKNIDQIFANARLLPELISKEEILSEVTASQKSISFNYLKIISMTALIIASISGLFWICSTPTPQALALNESIKPSKLKEIRVDKETPELMPLLSIKAIQNTINNSDKHLTPPSETQFLEQVTRTKNSYHQEYYTPVITDPSSYPLLPITKVDSMILDSIPFLLKKEFTREEVNQLELEVQEALTEYYGNKVTIDCKWKKGQIRKVKVSIMYEGQDHCGVYRYQTNDFDTSTFGWFQDQNGKIDSFFGFPIRQIKDL